MPGLDPFEKHLIEELVLTSQELERLRVRIAELEEEVARAAKPKLD